ncbi:hypothetical protein D3C72_2111390 [compost metagenome]
MFKELNNLSAFRSALHFDNLDAAGADVNSDRLHVGTFLRERYLDLSLWHHYVEVNIRKKAVSKNRLLDNN